MSDNASATAATALPTSFDLHELGLSDLQLDVTTAEGTPQPQVGNAERSDGAGSSFLQASPVDLFAYTDDKGKDEVQNAEAALWGTFGLKKKEAEERDTSAKDSSSEEHAQKSSDETDDSGTVALRLDEDTMKCIVTLFGDDGEKPSTTSVRVPLWIAQKIYEASKGLPIPDYAPSYHAEPSPSRESQQRGERQSSSPPRMADIMNEEEAQHRLLVQNFLGFFPLLPERSIEDVVRQCDYNYERSTDALRMLSDRVEATRQQFILDQNNRVKYSDMPKPIYPQRKGAMETAQADSDDPNLIDCTPEDADRMEAYARDHEAKANGYMQTANLHSNKMIAGYLTNLAKESRKEAKHFQEIADRIRVINSGEGIDLHYMTWDEAKRAFLHKMRLCKQHGKKKFRVVTGYGKYNKGVSVLKPRFIAFFQNNQIRYEAPSDNPGELTVYVQ